MVEKETFIQKVTEIVNQFFQTIFNVRPTNIRVMLEKEMIIIKLAGIFSPSEKNLTMTAEGDGLINKVYKSLFDRTSPILEKMLQQVVSEEIKSLKIEMHTKDMECFCFVTCSGNIEEGLNMYMAH